jgi:hypothetical protein
MRIAHVPFLKSAPAREKGRVVALTEVNGDLRSTLNWSLHCLVRRACRARTRDYCPAVAALVGPVQNIFFLTDRIHPLPPPQVAWRVSTPVS